MVSYSKLGGEESFQGMGSWRRERGEVLVSGAGVEAEGGGGGKRHLDSKRRNTKRRSGIGERIYRSHKMTVIELRKRPANKQRGKERERGRKRLRKREMQRRRERRDKERGGRKKEKEVGKRKTDRDGEGKRKRE